MVMGVPVQILPIDVSNLKKSVRDEFSLIRKNKKLL
jgi:hypothetical protein